MLKLRRAALGGLALLLSGAAVAPVMAADDGSSLDLKYMYFWDRNKVWNHTPAFTWIQKLPGYLRFKWTQEFDAVTGASRRLGLRNVGRLGGNDTLLDGLSGASRREIRHSEQPALEYSNRGTVASGSFYYSHEHDYTSYSPAVGLARDFNDRNTTVSASYALFLDDFHPVGPFRGQGGKRRIHAANLGVAQVVSPLSLFSVTVSPIRSTGYLGHPYNPAITATGAMLAEELPDSKLSAAFTGKWIQGWRWGERLGSAHMEFRHYRDDWRLASNTLDVHLHQYVAEGTYVRLRARGYDQGAAAFWKDAYAGNETYRTADIRFSSFSSLILGLKVASVFPDSWAESPLLPDRWDIGYDHGVRDTRGQGDGVRPLSHYQFYGTDQYYMQGTFMAGLGFDL